jgi:hypothetical protein
VAWPHCAPHWAQWFKIGGQHHLRKGSHVNDPAVPIETLERIEWAAFEAALGVAIVFDQNAPVLIIQLGTWRSGADADRVRDTYKNSETIRQLTPLLARPRERWVTRMDEAREA